MDAVFASSVVSEDCMQRVLERFQAAERALREGGQAAAAEASETAAAEGWNRVGSATSTQALNPFVAVLLGYEPPLGPARGASIPRDVPDTPVKVEPKAAAAPSGAPPAAATLGPSDVQTEREAGRASRNPAGAPPARRKKQNKQSSSCDFAGPDASSSSDSSSTPAVPASSKSPPSAPTLVLRAAPAVPEEPTTEPAPKFVAKRYKQDRTFRREQFDPVRGRTPPPPPESTRNRRAGRTPESIYGSSCFPKWAGVVCAVPVGKAQPC